MSPILLLALAAQVPPPAAPVPPRQPGATIVAEPAALFIAACDVNGDARTTRAELAACVARSFPDAAPQSGSAGYIGYSDWAQKWLGDRNALPSPYQADGDNDNRITLAELQAQFAVLFDRFDLDKDGVVTRAELVTIRSAAIPQDGDGGKRRGRR
ncbi:EF-hand domain-containing protein [Sphingomonas sp. UYP23]